LLLDDLDVLLIQLHELEERLDEKKKTSFIISQQFDEIDQTLANLTNVLNNVEIELTDSGNSSSSSDSARIHDEHFSDSGLSRSTDSISLPLISQQISNASSVTKVFLTKRKFRYFVFNRCFRVKINKFDLP